MPVATADEIAYENRWLRELLAQVAGELEVLAGRAGGHDQADALRRRAMRIRQRLHEGPPERDAGTGMGVGRGP